MTYASPTGIAPVLQVHPTRLCNLTCAHCYTSSSPQAREEITIDLLFACLEDAASLGYRQLAVSGGEPLMYAALPALLAEARRLGMLTTVTSNGMLATQQRWGRIAPLVDVLAISIDGDRPTHDAIRRRPGAFARTVSNFDVIRASGVPFGLIFTLTQHNVDSLESVVRLAAEHGARSVQVHPLTLHGRAATDMRESQPDSIELAAAIVEAARLGRQLGVVVHVDALAARQIADFRRHLVPELPIRRLTDVAPVLVLEADSSVVPLTHEVHRGFRLGRLSDGRLRSLAREWLDAGHGDRLAHACERTWEEIVRADRDAVVYWYEEVAARTYDDGGHSRRIPLQPIAN